jgi:hypothetical protein
LPSSCCLFHCGFGVFDFDDSIDESIWQKNEFMGINLAIIEYCPLCHHIVIVVHAATNQHFMGLHRIFHFDGSECVEHCCWWFECCEFGFSTKSIQHVIPFSDACPFLGWV